LKGLKDRLISRLKTAFLEEQQKIQDLQTQMENLHVKEEQLRKEREEQLRKDKEEQLQREREEQLRIKKRRTT